MRISKGTLGLATGAAAAATMLIVPAAFAASTLSVNGVTSPAADIPVTGNVKSPGVSFLSDFGIPTACTASTITGYVKRGASVTNGTKIGAITNLTFTGCTFVNTYPVIIKKDTKTGAPAEWPIHVVGNPAKGATLVDIEIRNVNVKMHSTIPAVPSPTNKWSCYLKATSTSVPAKFNQVTQQVIVNTAPSYPFDLTAYDGASESAQLPAPGGGTCGGQFYTGDKATMTGSFLVTSTGAGIHF